MIVDDHGDVNVQLQVHCFAWRSLARLLRHFRTSANLDHGNSYRKNLHPPLIINVALPPKRLINFQSFKTALSEGGEGRGEGKEGKGKFFCHIVYVFVEGKQEMWYT